LINQGNKQFKSIPTDQSGLLLPGETKHIVEIQGKTERYILALQNNEVPLLYKMNKLRSNH
jgi:hypothetical protein